jgi:TATA-box binding protein (TBP) (component of TFIID and TFIIIB)
MDINDLRISTMTQIAEISSKIELTNLYKYLEPTDTIKYISFGSELSKGEVTKKIKKPRKNKEKKFFYNQITLHIFYEKIVNVKIFNNGRIQMTGLKNNKQGIEIIKIFLEEVDKLSEEYKSEIYETVNPKFTWNKTVLINSDFDINYKIDREALHRSIIEAGYYSSFEPCIYPGVNIKYYYHKSKENNGICNCDKMCNGKGKDDTCKKITIAVFNSGKIIITGGNSMKHIEIAYNFIFTFIESRKDIIQMK